MAAVTWLVVCLLISLSSAQEQCPAINSDCKDTPMAIRQTSKNVLTEHYYIGGLFGLREKGDSAYQCGSEYRIRGIMNLQAFLWGINYFQERLPSVDRDKVSVGGVAFDNCLRKEQTIENILGFELCKSQILGVDRRQLLAFVGPDTSTEALAVADLARDLKIPLVSHAATSRELSDGVRYPYFLRTAPSDENDATIMADLLTKEINAEYAQLVYIDNDYGRHGMERFMEAIEGSSMCVAQKIKIQADVSADAIAEVVRRVYEKPNIRYVALFADGATSKAILEQFTAYNRVQAAQAVAFLFFGTSSWGTSLLGDGIFAANNSIVASIATDSAYAQAVQDFQNYWDDLKPNAQGTNVENKYFTEFWEQKFNCEVGVDCDLANENLRDIRMDVYVPSTLMAVDAIIRGIYVTSVNRCGNYHLCSNLLNLDQRGTAIFRAIKNATSTQNNNRFIFDRTVGPDNQYTTGDLSKGSQGFTKYNLYSVVDNNYRQLGTYAPGDGLNLNRDLDQDSFYRDKAICPYPCVECGEVATTRAPATDPPSTSPGLTTPADPTQNGSFVPVWFPISQQLTGAYHTAPRGGLYWMTRFEIGQRWIIALGVLAGLGILAVIVFEIYILYKLLGTRMGSRWRTMWLGQLLLFGIFLSYLTLFAFILIPTKATCGITRFGIGVSYAIMFAVLLVKLMVILTSKTSESSLLPGDIESPNYLKGIYQFLMFMFAVGVQIVIDSQWLITVPPEAVLVTDNNGNMSWICNHYTWSVQSGMTNMTTFVRNEFENHLLSLVYIMFLILITTVLALNAHGIITNHRESIFIGIAAGFSIPIWLAWGLVGGLNRENRYAHEFGDACLAFGLFLTATLILFAMFLPKVRQLVNIGVEGIYFEDDRETYYAGSVIMAPPSYKSKANSVIYVNNQGIYSEPVHHTNGDPLATHLKHPGQHPMSTYSAPPGFMKKGDTGSKVLRVTPDLTGKHPTERRRPASEYAYTPRSVKGTLKRSRSQQNLGAL